MNFAEIWARAVASLEDGRPVRLCFVVAQTKGSPGTTAARMLVDKSGRIAGTIGGGIMERSVIDDAVANLLSGHDGPPRLRRLRHTAGHEEASGLICGGAQSVVEHTLFPERDLELARSIAAAFAEEAAGYLEVSAAGWRLFENAPPFPGALVFDQIDSVWTSRIRFRNQRRIAIFGGGHCGAALASTMRRLEYAVSVIEPRGDLPTLAALDPTIRTICAPFEAGAGAVLFAPETIAAVMTYSMATDVEALAGALSVDFASIGLMGSRPKIVRIRKELERKGFKDSQIGKIRAPVGLDFNSDTPEEIAISVAAQLLLERESV